MAYEKYPRLSPNTFGSMMSTLSILLTTCVEYSESKRDKFIYNIYPHKRSCGIITSKRPLMVDDISLIASHLQQQCAAQSVQPKGCILQLGEGLVNCHRCLDTTMQCIIALLYEIHICGWKRVAIED